MPIDDLPHVLREPAAEPAGALVLLHGRGTSECDLEPLLGALDPDARLAGACPRAPLALPPGGNHWYATREVGFPDPETFEQSRATLAGWLDALPDALGVPWERTVLGGFSQGAVMAWALGLGAGRPRPAGILAMSGFIPAVEGLQLDLDGLDGYPVAVTHGAQDPVIDARFGRDAAQRLRDAGADVLHRESAVQHTVDPALLPELRGWLRAVSG